MPLRSLMLKDDAALQACLLQDRDHVTPGSTGNHVAKIQKSLLLLEQAPIAIAELRARAYGATTAAAVLAYKRRRQIVNLSYQQTADNIVGKMTIARLDADLLLIEQRDTPGRVVCRDSHGGGSARVALASPSASPTSSASALVASGKAPRRFNATLRIIIQETTASEALGGSFSLILALHARARELMAPHGIDFAGGAIPEFGPRVPDSDFVIPGSPAICFSVRESAERALRGFPQTLRVIVCPFTDQGNAFGVTDGGSCGTSNFPKFCLINVRKRHLDLGTLLHEMIHAARPEKVEHDDKDPLSVFSEALDGRTTLPAKHADSLANSAFFSTVRL